MRLDPISQILQQRPSDFRVITVKHVDSFAQNDFTDVFVGLVQTWLFQHLQVVSVETECPLANAPYAVCHLVEVLSVEVLLFQVPTHICLPGVKVYRLHNLQIVEAQDDLDLFVLTHALVHDGVETAEGFSSELPVPKHLFEGGHKATE